MFRLMWHFLSVGSIVSFIILIFSIFLIIIKKKVSEKVWRILCFVPLIISIIHFIVYFVPNDFIINRYKVQQYEQLKVAEELVNYKA